MKFKSDKSKILLHAVEQHGDTVFVGERYDDLKKGLYDFKLDEWTTSHGKNKNANSESTLKLASVRPFGKWFESRFGNIKSNYVSYGGIIAISKRDIQQHPVRRYEDLIKELETSSNPEVGQPCFTLYKMFYMSRIQFRPHTMLEGVEVLSSIDEYLLVLNYVFQRLV